MTCPKLRELAIQKKKEEQTAGNFGCDPSSADVVRMCGCVYTKFKEEEEEGEGVEEVAVYFAELIKLRPRFNWNNANEQVGNSRAKNPPPLPV